VTNTLPRMDKPKLNDLLAQLTGEVEKISRDVARLAKGAAESPTGQQVRRTIDDLRPQVRRAVDEIGPEVRKVYGQVAPQVKKVVGEVVPGLRGAWQGVFGKGSPDPKPTASGEAPPNVSPDAFATGGSDMDAPVEPKPKRSSKKAQADRGTKRPSPRKGTKPKPKP
jgi:hypothetical protein